MQVVAFSIRVLVVEGDSVELVQPPLLNDRAIDDEAGLRHGVLALQRPQLVWALHRVT